MPQAEADRWVVATAFASVMATVVAGAVGWWAGRAQPTTAGPVERTVSQRVTASGRGQAAQVGGNQNTPAPGGAGGGPSSVEQEAEVADDASVTQVGGDQRNGLGDDEQLRRS
ncbi:hypothetical protein QNO07_26165 [Streptomyces sp. 549]|uniref:hypothetical protein n=1 Tax=Streptomyces sp. 549 TaxID=3049076 RepID=UPI0024C42108|nr:hypothetical protein [Streptomyces sp. 549]MDK1476845.1 hypothetical protein [Streptomyces sp. 549]